MSRAAGQVVSLLALIFDDTGSIPTEVYNFLCKIVMKRRKINKKRLGLPIHVISHE